MLKFHTFIQACEDPNMKLVLTRLGVLFGLFHLEKHVGHLYQGGYFQGDKQRVLLQEAILSLCAMLKDEAVTLVDAIAPDDFLLNSVLGKSDGLVYQRLQRSIFTGEGNMSRVKWWDEVVTKKNSKL